MAFLRRHIASFGLAAIVLCPAAARASDWIVTVGGRGEALVPYEGAGYDIFLPTPSISLRRADRPERPTIPDDGVGVTLLRLGPLSGGPVVRLRGKRNDADQRAGLHEVPLAIEPGLFASIWAADWLRLHGEMRKGVRGHSGWIGDAGLDLAVRNGSWTATLGPRVGWGDHHYMDEYFEVTPAEAAASPFIDAAYTPPSGGLRYVGLETTLNRRLGPHWQTNANFGFHRLASTPADSPIVRQIGDRNEISGGVGLKYNFTWSR
jgi:outer membrane protein